MTRENTESDTVRRILDEATPLFVARGYQGVSMREIGEAVGITKAALYYHFKDKEELFMAILRESLDELGRILDEAERSEPTARGQVGQAVRGLLGLPAERRALIRVATQEMAHVSPAVRAAFNGVYQEKFVGRIVAMLRGGMDRGEVKRVDPQLAAWLLLGLAYPFFNATHLSVSAAEGARVLVDVFFDGLGR